MAEKAVLARYYLVYPVCVLVSQSKPLNQYGQYRSVVIIYTFVFVHNTIQCLFSP